MKVIYYADDGTEFETEEECLEYENLQSVTTQKMLSEIHAFTEKGKEIRVGDGPKEYDIENMITETMYVTFDSDEARYFFDEQQEYYGYRPIHECTSCKNGDVFVYRDGCDEWESAMEMIEHYQGLLWSFKGKEPDRNKIYYIQNTINEYQSRITGYYSSFEKAKEALKECNDWYRSKGTGKIYKVQLDVSAFFTTLIYEN